MEKRKMVLLAVFCVIASAMFVTPIVTPAVSAEETITCGPQAETPADHPSLAGLGGRIGYGWDGPYLLY